MLQRIEMENHYYSPCTSVKQRWHLMAKYGQISKTFHYASKWNETPSKSSSKQCWKRRRISAVNSSHGSPDYSANKKTACSITIR